jgi:hypothetical protein
VKPSNIRCFLLGAFLEEACPMCDNSKQNYSTVCVFINVFFKFKTKE